MCLFLVGGIGWGLRLGLGLGFGVWGTFNVSVYHWGNFRRSKMYIRKCCCICPITMSNNAFEDWSGSYQTTHKPELYSSVWNSVHSAALISETPFTFQVTSETPFTLQRCIPVWRHLQEILYEPISKVAQGLEAPSSLGDQSKAPLMYIQYQIIASYYVY